MAKLDAPENAEKQPLLAGVLDDSYLEQVR